MTKDEALMKALEALENINNWLPTIGQKGLRDYEADAITAIKEALAQPEEQQGLIDVALLKENEDGSAVYSFELSDDMKDAFVRFGIMQALKAGIEEARELHPGFGGTE